MSDFYKQKYETLVKKLAIEDSDEDQNNLDADGFKNSLSFQ